MKKVLVTGIAGFIGAHTARQLLGQGIEVVGVDNLNDYYDPRLKQHRLDSLSKEFRFEFYQADIENKQSLELIFKRHRFDTVFNLAARAGVHYSLINPTIYFTTNMLGSLNLLDCMHNYGVQKIVIASTSSLYAGELTPFTEDMPVNRPISPYAASKKAAEQICFTYHYQYHIDCTVVRYFTVYGPAGRPDMSIFRFIRWIDQGLPVVIYGDGEQTRDFTFVEDIARGTILAARPLGFEVINLGGGRRPVSINQAIRFIESGLNKKAIIVHKPLFRSDLTETQANISKAKHLLDWQPLTDLPEGIEKSIKWYADNRPMALSLDLP